MKLIFEKSRPGRRAGRLPAHDLPAPEVPDELRRAEAAAASRDRRAGSPAPLHRALDAQLRRRHGLLPARLVHDEAQPARERAVRVAPRVPRPAPARGRGPRAGSATALRRAPGGAGGSHRSPGGVPSAGGRLAGRAHGADADARLLRGSRRGRAAAQDRHPRHRPWHEPGQRDDDRVRADARPDRRAREHRRRRPAHQGRRAHGGADAHEPVDAGPLRREHRGDRAHLPRRGSAHVLRRREPERRLRDLAARATWASTSSTSICTRRSRSRTEAAARAAARSRSRRGSSRSCRFRRSSATATASASTTTARARSGRFAATTGRSASSSGRTRSSVRTGRRCARCPR